MMYGDGTIKASGDIYYTSSQSLADGTQAMLISAGHYAVVYGPFESGTSYGQCQMFHVVRPRHNHQTRVLYTSRRLRLGTTRESPKEGYAVVDHEARRRRVVCFDVPNSTLITRSRGKPAIHGNCKHAAHLIRLLRMDVEFLQTGEFNVYRTGDADEIRAIKRGEWSLEQVQAHAGDLFALADDLYERSTLPDQPDRARAEHLLVEVTQSWICKRPQS